jgi:gluconolactonase
LLPAGRLAFAGRASNPLDRDERFQLVLTIIPLSCSPDATTLRSPALEDIMPTQPHISRRHMLALSAAAGGAAASGLGSARAQQRPRLPAEIVLTPRIDQFDPALDKIISTSEPIREIASGFGGPLGPAEGPLWWKEGGYLLFSDINASRRMKYTPGQGVTVFQEKTNQANGLTRDLQGRLLACEHETRRVTRQEHDGSIAVIANSFQGRRLNRPNDVIVRSDGSIYFTDPWSSPLAPEQWDLPYSGVYRVTPDLGTITLLLDDMVFPNGLAFSPDESVIYIDDFRRGHIRAFALAANGTLAKQTDRVFADLTGPEPGGPDGMKVDTAGNVYCGGAGGIYILDPQGKKLGRIVHGQPATTNIGFGGDDLKTLFFTSRSHLGSVNIKIAGIPAPPPKKT